MTNPAPLDLDARRAARDTDRPAPTITIGGILYTMPSSPPLTLLGLAKLVGKREEQGQAALTVDDIEHVNLALASVFGANWQTDANLVGLDAADLGDVLTYIGEVYQAPLAQSSEQTSASTPTTEPSSPTSDGTTT